MAVVLQGSNGGGNKKGPVSSLIAYGVVGVFGIAVICMTLFGGPKADPLDKDYSYNKYNDLADMAFSDDAAEAELLASGKYNDIAKNDLINALFSKEDKENRIQEYKVNGAPPPPDAEYAEAAQKKAEVKQAKERYNRARRTYAGSGKGGKKQTTSKNSLSSRGGVSFSNGGGSGLSRSVWQDNEKKDKYGNDKSSDPIANGARSLKNGRSAILAARNLSKKAAETNDLEASARYASDAFNNGVVDGVLHSDLEAAAAELDLDAKVGELDKDKKGLAASNLDKKLAEAKEKKEREKQEMKCDGVYMGGQYNAMCTMNKLLEAGMELGKSALNSLLSKKNGGDAESAVEAYKTELELEKQKQTTAEKEKAKTEAEKEKSKAEQDYNQKKAEADNMHAKAKNQTGQEQINTEYQAAQLDQEASNLQGKVNEADGKVKAAETEYNASKKREEELGAKKTCLENGGKLKKCSKLVTSAV